MYIYNLYPYQSEFLPFSLSFTIETSSDKAESFLINFYGPFFRDFSSITIGTQAHTIISIIVDLLNHSFEKQYSKILISTMDERFQKFVKRLKRVLLELRDWNLDFEKLF